MHRHRQLHRDHRRERNAPIIALVGYTNAGKSTLLNAMSGAEVLAEDKLRTRDLGGPADTEGCGKAIADALT